MNGYGSPLRNEYDDRTPGHAGEDDRHYSDYLAAPRAPGLSKHTSVVSSMHDGDSLFDLYGGGRSSMIGGTNDELSGQTLVTADQSYMGGYSLTAPDSAKAKDPEASKWIHRDKLAQIEGNEAADYLYDVGQSRWIHKDKLEMIEIEELQRNGERRQQASVTPRGDENRDRKQQPQQLRLPSPENSSSDEEVYHDADFYEIRTLEEQASDAQSNAMRKDFRRNPSYSRIPLATVSPHPIPQQFLERTTPLPRTATVTPNGSDDGTSQIPTLRKRSYSAGSAVLLDGRDLSNTAAGQTTSAVQNPKTRTVTSPASRGSKAPRTNSIAGKRARSNPQLTHRPATSASNSIGSGPGSAGKSPKGQPPWVVASYKPDPSLPPDQQIIPTLAKRMQQEQWERDGVYASVYDKELRPLKVGDGDVQSPGKDGQSTFEMTDEWPLRRSVQAEPAEPKQQERTSPSTDGGYRTMPNVSSFLADMMPDGYPWTGSETCAKLLGCRSRVMRERAPQA